MRRIDRTCLYLVLASLGAPLAAAPLPISLNGVGTTTGNAASSNALPSANGQYVAFESRATDLVLAVPDGNATFDVYSERIRLFADGHE